MDQQSDQTSQQSQPSVAPQQPYVPPAPAAPGQTPSMQQGPLMENPGQTLGIVGLVCNFLGITIAGIVLGVMSRNKSKQANMSSALGTISLVWGIVGTVLAVLLVGFFILMAILSSASGVDSSY